jgi:hypothetical protein
LLGLLLFLPCPPTYSAPLPNEPVPKLLQIQIKKVALRVAANAQEVQARIVERSLSYVQTSNAPPEDSLGDSLGRFVGDLVQNLTRVVTACLVVETSTEKRPCSEERGNVRRGLGELEEGLEGFRSNWKQGERPQEFVDSINREEELANRIQGLIEARVEVRLLLEILPP